MGCPHCHALNIVKNGQSHGLQRYRCNACAKTFNAATGTPLSRLRNKERFFQQGKCLAEGLSVRAAAEVLDVAVTTAFRLRHRFLESAVTHQPKQVSGLLEADETYFRESQKGSRKPKLPGSAALLRKARHRGGKADKSVKGKTSRKDLVPVLVGRLRGQPHVADRVLSAMDAAQATDALRGWVGPDTLLCTDGSGALRKAAADLGVTAKSIAVSYDGRVSDEGFHVQSVNSYHQRLKSWINRDLRGVATSYLPNYLAWMRIREWFKTDLKPEHFVVSGLGKQVINT
jgi:transposase-like protein